MILTTVKCICTPPIYSKDIPKKICKMIIIKILNNYNYLLKKPFHRGKQVIQFLQIIPIRKILKKEVNMSKKYILLNILK